MGSEIPPADLYSVPGNHDQWNGKPQGLTKWLLPADNPDLDPCRSAAHALPQHDRQPNNDFVLDLIGVDSNSGLSGHRGNMFAER